jgi:hypothetical protein
MQGADDIDQTTTTSEGDRLEPGEAARLLAQTQRDARRQFDPGPTWLAALLGAVILVGYGALWLSTRGQHPYSGPSAGLIVLVYVAVVGGIGFSVKAYQRATAGVSGPATRQRAFEGVAIMLSFFASPVIQGAMEHYGASHAIVYGVIPAAGPLIIVGSTVLGVAASKADWPQFGAALTVVIGGIVALYVGPSGAWLAAGIGLSIGVICCTAASGKRLLSWPSA